MSLVIWKRERPAAAEMAVALAGLANGAGVQGDLVPSDGAMSAIVTVRATAGSAPTPGEKVKVYLLRHDGRHGDDGCGAGAGPLTRENAPLLGELTVQSAGHTVTGTFRTDAEGALGPLWGIVVVNATGGALGADPSLHSVRYQMLEREADLDWYDAAGVSPAASPFVVGEVRMVAGANVPVGWLLCDGRAVGRTTYAELFAFLGTTWGAGDGSTTFNLPDFRGRSPIGTGQGSGLTNRALAAAVGAEAHQLTASEMPSHTHQLTAVETANTGHTHAPNADEIATPPSDPSGSVSVSTTSAGSDVAHNNMQPSLAVHFMIRAAA